VAFDDPFGDGTDGTRVAIMEATYEALTEHGYENLTMQRIDDQFPKSKSLIYQHYDGKDEVLVALLEFLLTQFEAAMPQPESTDPHDRFRNVIDFVLDPSPAAERSELTDVMVELRGQAPHNGAFRAYFTDNDRDFRCNLAGIIAAGIEDGVYRPVDPDAVAEFVLTTMEGGVLRRSTTDAADVRTVRSELDAYVQSRLLRGE
jgi:AcrR family transcriptional regulator